MSLSNSWFAGFFLEHFEGCFKEVTASRDFHPCAAFVRQFPESIAYNIVYILEKVKKPSKEILVITIEQIKRKENLKLMVFPLKTDC